MKDFDFEELDRAVHSATAPKTPEPTPEPSLESAPEPVPEPTPSPVARRTSGRFMDVMHPSSDMRQSTSSSSSPVPARVETPMQEESELPVEESSPQSPFIPDAVVEKRPLGPAIDLFKEPEHELLEDGDEVTKKADTEAQTKPTPEPEVAMSTEVTDTHKVEAPETPSGAMYDTEIYHPPAPQSKKKSGVWVVLWIFLLILLGAGAGAAVYFFVLPLL